MAEATTRGHAVAIWRAGVEAVRPERCVAGAISIRDGRCDVGGCELPWREGSKLIVLGAGKAAAGMARGVLDAVRRDGVEESRVSGLVSVPADCVTDLGPVETVAGRPAGRNEPTDDAVAATDRMLAAARATGPDEVVLLLISGGASALLAKPADGVKLAEKLAVSRRLAAAGASIVELNAVRRELSAVKGGRFADAIATPHAATLLISDIVGDPPELIGSGPTVASTPDPAGAMAILRRYAIDPPASVRGHLLRATKSPPSRSGRAVPFETVGSNAVAVAAAAEHATSLGYDVESLGSTNEGIAAAAGATLVDRAAAIRARLASDDRPVCLLSGGEPTVRLAETDRPRKGGRNQELAAAAAMRLGTIGADGITLLSGGTDGEDGPTDAAGGFADAAVAEAFGGGDLDPAASLAINDSYPLLERAGGLFKTGPTGTNVMDLRVVLIRP